MLIFIIIWYLLTIVTYGVWVPAGLFLPGMIIGCAIGSAYENIEREIFGEVKDNPSVLPVLVASGAMIAGYT